jgi:hypothetical protein
MRIIVGATAGVLLFLVSSVSAQQPNSAASVDRVRLALERLQEQPTTLTIPTLQPWTTPAPRRLGILTLIPPQTDGQLIRVGVPIGDLAARAARAVSSARHRRAERKASERVQRALEELQTVHRPRAF